MSTGPVRLPSQAQLDHAIRFFAARHSEWDAMNRENGAEVKVLGKRHRAELRQWRADPINAGLDYNGLFVLEDTASSIVSRHFGIELDRSMGVEFWGYEADGADERPFSQILNKRYFTPAEIDRLDNGQLPNVLITAGGWGSRSHWVAVVTEIPRLLRNWKRGTMRDVERANEAAKTPWWGWMLEG